MSRTYGHNKKPEKCFAGHTNCEYSPEYWKKRNRKKKLKLKKEKEKLELEEIKRNDNK